MITQNNGNYYGSPAGSLCVVATVANRRPPDLATIGLPMP